MASLVQLNSLYSTSRSEDSDNLSRVGLRTYTLGSWQTAANGRKNNGSFDAVTQTRSQWGAKNAESNSSRDILYSMPSHR